MNDWEAMEAINQVLEQHWSGGLSSNQTLMEIAYISGANKISREEARQQ